LRVAVIAPGAKTEGGITEVIRLMLPALEDAGVSVTWIATHRSGGRLGKAAELLAGFGKAVRTIPRTDVVHIHSSYWISCLRKSLFFWLARAYGKPVIWHLHVPDQDFFDLFGGSGFLGRYARWIVEQCQLVVVLSESWRPLASRCLPSVPLRVIYNPAVAPRWVTSASRACEVLYLGHLIPRKGYDVLIRAFASAAKDRPAWRLVFAGSGELDRARQLAAEFGVGDRVAFEGWIGPARKTDLLARAAIFALPSYQEGLPMSVLEAMAAGIPVVVTPVGGIPDLVADGESGFIVPAGASSELAAALTRLMDDEGLRHAVGERGQRAVRHLDPEPLAQEWLSAYRRVLSTESREGAAAAGDRH
jgi:glycosyltransferase involved in cell wall biosynthesis